MTNRMLGRDEAAAASGPPASALRRSRRRISCLNLFIPRAAQDRQAGVLCEPRIGVGQQAAVKYAAPIGAHDPDVFAARAQSLAAWLLHPYSVRRPMAAAACRGGLLGVG